MQPQGLRCLVVGVFVALAAVTPQPAGAQSCYEVSSKITDICPVAGEAIYVTSQVMHIRAVAVSEAAGTNHYLLYHYPNSLDVYSVNDPLRPAKIGKTLQLPWSFDDGNHTNLTDHLMPMVAEDGFPYAFTPLYGWGWDWFEVGSAPKFLKLGFRPPENHDPPYVGGALIVNGDTAYLVGQGLDAQSIAKRDSSFKIYEVSTRGASKWSLPRKYDAMTDYAVLEAGRRSDPPPFNSFNTFGVPVYLSWETGGTRFLLVRMGANAVLVDVTHPLFPRLLRLLARSFNSTAPGASQVIVAPDLFAGTWAIDRVRSRLIVSSYTEPKVSFYDVSAGAGGVPSFASVGQPLPWLPAKPGGNFSPFMAISGDVLYLGIGDEQRYVNVGTNPPQLLPEQTAITTLTRVCAYETLGGEDSRDSAVFVRDGVHFIARNLNSSGDVVRISPACMSTEPKPMLAISGGSSGATCPGSGSKGFPGDVFTITNESAGEWTDGDLYITPAGGQREPADYPGIFTQTSKTFTWTAPNIGPFPRTYAIDVKVFDATGNEYDSWDPEYGTTKYITICGDPEAKITYAPTAFLTGTQLTFKGATSEGHPQNVNTGGPKFTWLFASPNVSEEPVVSTADEPTFTPNSRGRYLAVLIAHYPHDNGDQLGDCGQVDNFDVQDFLGDAANFTNAYDSCTAVEFDSQPFSVGAVSVTQGGSSAQPFQVSKSVALSAPYKLGSGWNATFGWTVKDAAGATKLQPAATPSSPSGPADGTVTGSIAASSLPAGSYTVHLTASATSGGDTVTPTVAAVPFTLTDVLATLSCPRTVTAGQMFECSVELNAAAANLHWDFGKAPCPNQGYTQTVDCDPNKPFCTSQVYAYNTAESTSTATVSVTLKDASGGAIGAPVTASVAITAGTCDSGGGGGGGGSGGGGGGGGGGCTAPVASFTFSPSAPAVDQQIQFTDTSLNVPTEWKWEFGDGVGPVQGSTSTERNPRFAYASAGTYTVRLTASNDCGANSTQRNVTVVNTCTKANPAVAAFTFSPAEPKVGEKILFTDTSTGEPESWEWDFGDGIGIIASSKSTQRNPQFAYEAEGTYTVTLTVKNCKNTTPSSTTRQVTVRPACGETAKPVVDFTWTPTGALPGVPQQQQPYVGQEVTLTATGTNHPTEWQWSDFQELHKTFTTQTVKVTWTQAGDKNVRLKGKNCFAWSDELLKAVKVYPDVRPVKAEFTWQPAAPQTGQAVVFSAVSDAAHGDPTEFSWRFGDDQSTGSGQSVPHTFECRGTYQVALIARRGSIQDSTTESVTVSGDACGPESVIAADAAQVPGLNGTSWRTDLRIFNPSEASTQLFLAVLPAGQNNVTPFQVGPYTVPPNGAVVLNNILQMFELLLGKEYTKAALRITFENEENLAPIVIGRTYTDIAGGGTMGQFVPGRPVVPNSTPSTLWIAGGRNNGTTDGFRTNFGIANLRGDPSGVAGIELAMYDATGSQVGAKTLSLAPYGYLQDAVKNIFGSAALGEVGPFAIKVGIPEGADLEPYISVVDNHTGDNVLISGTTSAEGAVYLPAVAHNKGEAGTVWRTSLQMTNPDGEAHTWEAKFFPKGDIPGAFRNITVAPQQTVYADDVIGWMYSPMEAPEASGIVRIEPADGKDVLPIAAGRTYNLTASGTYGQDIPALAAAHGIRKGGEHERMVITGMSSADISRSNLGFVSLSDTSGVDFAVYFYDENGTLLNPEGKAYTYAIGPNGWDQDKLENRFKNFFRQELPAGQRVISAVIEVRSGGPGFAYASVIDSITGDPIFIPAYLLP